MLNVGLASNGVANGELTVGDVAMITAYFNSIKRPLSFLGSTYRDLVQAKIDFETMWKLMESRNEMLEGNNTIPKTESGVEIKMENVGFGYNSHKTGMK